jgi:RNA polymerase sigma-70 factor (ECF subfamily)
MDKAGFNKLMTYLRPKMYRFALAFIRRADEAEDIVQEVGLKLWENLPTIGNVEAYAMSSVKNRCLDYARSPRNRTDELIEANDTAHEQTPYKSLEHTDMIAFVRRLIGRLPEQQQMVMHLRDIEGYELEEIAEIIGINEGTVRVNLSRARQKIREELLKQ